MSQSLGAMESASSRLAGRVAKGGLRHATMGQILACIVLIAMIPVVAKSPLLLCAAAAGILAVTVGCWALSPRAFATFAFVYSVPFSLMHHFVYIPNVGAADGLTIQLVDVWALWLLADYAWSLRTGTAQTVHGLKAFCVPIALLLMADMCSFIHSVDMELSIYGLFDHTRQAVLFIALAVTLAQGKKERRAAGLAILCTVITIGVLCIGETVLHTNISPQVDLGMSDDIFRAGGMGMPTGTAAYLAVLLPLVAVEYLFPLSFSRKLLAGIGICLGVAGLGCTLTRSAIGILAIGLTPLLFFCFRIGRIRIRHAIFLILLAAGVVLPWARLGDKVSERAEDGLDSFNGRVALNKTALSMGLNAPLFGEGVNNYVLKMQEFFPKDEHQTFEYLVHNKFLLTFAETGILGLLGFVWLQVVAVRRAFSLARSGLPLGAGLFCSMIVLVLSMNCESYEGNPILLNMWFVIAAVAALWSSHSAKLHQDTKVQLLRSA